jgi:hypothetical protein
MKAFCTFLQLFQIVGGLCERRGEGNPSLGSFISIYLPIKGIGDKAFRFAGNRTVWVILQRNNTISLVAEWIFIFLFLFDNEFGKLRGKQSCANKYLPSPQFHSRFLLINFLFK